MRLIASIIALILLAIALHTVSGTLSLTDILAYIQQAKFEWIAIAVILSLLGHVNRIIRSVRVLGWEAPTSVRACAQALTGGQMINWLSPIRAGEVWRIWHVSQSGRNSLLWAASSVVLEKGADSLVLAAFAVILLFSPPPQGISVPLMRLLTTILTCMMMLSAISAVSSSRLRNKLLGRMSELNGWLNRASLSRLMPEQLDASRKPSRWMEMLAYSTAIWVLGLLTNIAVAQAFNIHVSVTTHLLFLLMLQTTTILAPVPGNVGVFPLIALSVFGAVGVDVDQAVAFGSVLYVLAYGVLISVASVAFTLSWRLSNKAAPSMNHAVHN